MIDLLGRGYKPAERYYIRQEMFMRNFFAFVMLTIISASHVANASCRETRADLRSKIQDRNLELLSDLSQIGMTMNIPDVPTKNAAFNSVQYDGWEKRSLYKAKLYTLAADQNRKDDLDQIRFISYRIVKSAKKLGLVDEIPKKPYADAEAYKIYVVTIIDVALSLSQKAKYGISPKDSTCITYDADDFQHQDDQAYRTHLFPHTESYLR